MTEPRYVMMGAGGHARVLQEILSLQGIEFEGFVAQTSESRLVAVPWLGDDRALTDLDPDAVTLVNGIGSSSSTALRARVYGAARAAGYRFLTVIDETAVVRPSVSLQDGVQILARAVVSSDVSVGANTLINTGAIVEHHAKIGANAHVSVGALLAGDVRVSDGVHIGIGASVIQGVSIGASSTIGAGAVVTRDVADGVVAVGVPAVSRPGPVS